MYNTMSCSIVSLAFVFWIICLLSVPSVNGFVSIARPPVIQGSSSQSLLLFLPTNERSSFSLHLQASSSSSDGDQSTLSKNDSVFGFTPSSTTTVSSVVPSRFVRWHPSVSGNEWNLQTAVTTFQHPVTQQRVELHAMVHFADPSYYQVYNKQQEQEEQEAQIVLYELLLDESMLTVENPNGFRRVAPGQALSASVADRQTAARYQWACQVDVLDYQQPHWRHADWTRQEFQHALSSRQGKSGSRGSINSYNNNNNNHMAAWQQVSSPSAATEAATALFVGPPTMMMDKSSRRRLFSNLFLPGSTLAQVLRLALWMTVPAPELSILLLDWSSTTSSSDTSRRSRSNSSYYRQWQASWSPIVRFLLQAAWSARLDIIQRLAFGQVLLTGSRPSLSYDENDTASVAQSLLIQGRNQQALKVFDETLALENETSVTTTSNQQKKRKTIALLYGSSHCPDLSRALRQRGFVPQSTTWRTAWSVALDTNAGWTSSSSSSSSSIGTAPLWLVPATLYLAASGADWFASWQAILTANDNSVADMALLAAAYGIRHVLLYLGISKVVLDWQRPLEEIMD